MTEKEETRVQNASSSSKWDVFLRWATVRGRELPVTHAWASILLVAEEPCSLLYDEIAFDPTASLIFFSSVSSSAPRRDIEFHKNFKLLKEKEKEALLASTK